MANTFGNFAKGLRQTAAELPERVNELKKSVVNVCSTDMIKRTQVDTGEAMSNWIVNNNTPIVTPRPAFVPSPRGYMAKVEGYRHWTHRIPPDVTRQNNLAPALDAASAALGATKPGDDVHITNSVPHIGFLDNGTDTIAPANFTKHAILLAEGFISRYNVLK